MAGSALLGGSVALCDEDVNVVPWDEWISMSKKERKKALKNGKHKPRDPNLMPVASINGDDLSGEGNSNPPRPQVFSDFLSTPIVAVRVGPTLSKTYYLHSGLLIRESTRFKQDLTGSFREAKEKIIDLPDEEAHLFGHFVKYLCYTTGDSSNALPLPESGHAGAYILLAELYALGERLLSTGFQGAALRNFCSQSCQYGQPLLPDYNVCDLLKIACEQITERRIEDPLRDQIFWHAARRLAQLNTLPRFQEMLIEVHGLARQMAIRADNSSGSQPQVPPGNSSDRFEDEVNSWSEVSETAVDVLTENAFGSC